VLDTLTTVLLSLSIFGAFAVVMTFGIFKSLRTFPVKLIIYLCVCIFMGYLFFLFAFEDWVYNSAFCQGCAFIVHFFFLAQFFWTTCIAFNFYQMIVQRNRDAAFLEKYYHIVAWGLSSIICIVTAATGNYGLFNGQICYINNSYARTLAFFIPGLVVLACNFILFFYVGREIHETLATAPKSDRSEKRKEFRVYLSIICSIGLAWIFGYLMFLPRCELQLVFLFLFSITTPMQGFLLFVAYCVNKKVALKWLGVFNFVPGVPALANRLETGEAMSRSMRSGRSGRSVRRTPGSTTGTTSKNDQQVLSTIDDESERS